MARGASRRELPPAPKNRLGCPARGAGSFTSRATGSAQEQTGMPRAWRGEPHVASYRQHPRTDWDAPRMARGASRRELSAAEVGTEASARSWTSWWCRNNPVACDVKLPGPWPGHLTGGPTERLWFRPLAWPARNQQWPGLQPGHELVFNGPSVPGLAMASRPTGRARLKYRSWNLPAATVSPAQTRNAFGIRQSDVVNLQCVSFHIEADLLT